MTFRDGFRGEQITVGHALRILMMSAASAASEGGNSVPIRPGIFDWMMRHERNKRAAWLVFQRRRHVSILLLPGRRLQEALVGRGRGPMSTMTAGAKRVPVVHLY